jgi:hypothetical protein
MTSSFPARNSRRKDPRNKKEETKREKKGNMRTNPD